MPVFKTEQEAFWAGDFGDGYTERNGGPEAIAAKVSCWSRVLAKTRGVRSVLELGANVGLNLHALRTLLPHAKLSAVEINAGAAERLRSRIPGAQVHNVSILDFEPTETVDLAFTFGVLIHISPDVLQKAYDVLYRSSNKYIVLGEYYNPSPVTVTYRGENERLFKRDFAGELMDMYPDLKLMDYGFVYRRDYNFALDDITWFLLEKQA